MEKNKEYRKKRKKLARIMRRLYERGLTTTSGGNISCRLSDDLIAITPSATDKGEMRWKEIAIMTYDGKNLTPDQKPSIESGMHISIYNENAEVSAIVHAHPPFASAFTAMNYKIDTSLTAEAQALLGEPAIAPYALMGTPELAEIVGRKVHSSNVVLLKNHGILTTGPSLLHAFNMLEVLEAAAKMTFITELMGKKRSLTKKRIAEINKIFR
jgi:L-fuculose-phosphate aldolase